MVRHRALIVVEWRVIAEEMSIVITCNQREGDFMGFFWKEQLIMRGARLWIDEVS